MREDQYDPSEEAKEELRAVRRERGNVDEAADRVLHHLKRNQFADRLIKALEDSLK